MIMSPIFQTEVPPLPKNTEKQHTAKHSKQIYRSLKPVVRLKEHKILAVNPQWNVKKKKEEDIKTYQQAPWTADNTKLI